MTNSNNKTNTNEVISEAAADAPEQVSAQGSAQDSVQGRGAFIVEITAAGVAVASTVVTEDGRALAMPAIFPNLGYALSQIDEMRNLVIRHFEQASQIGAQVIAQQLAQQGAAAAATSAAAGDSEASDPASEQATVAEAEASA
jgi:hypothetical protein